MYLQPSLVKAVIAPEEGLTQGIIVLMLKAQKAAASSASVGLKRSRGRGVSGCQRLGDLRLLGSFCENRRSCKGL